MTAAPPPRQPRTASEERRIRAIVGSGTALIRTVATTWRVRRIGDGPWRRLKDAGEPAVLTCWHGELLPLLWCHRDLGITVLVSEHRDGELIARVAERLGFRTIRGSTSRGGGRALLALVRALRNGDQVAITPDGPRGPAHRYAPGTMVAAHRAGAPVIPIALGVSRAWRLSSWDRFIIPHPFSRITVAYGEPTRVEAPDARSAAELTTHFAELHAAASRRAQG